MAFDRTTIVRDLTHEGRLRAAINLGNPILAQRTNGAGLGGVTVALAQELAKRLEVPLDLVPFPSAGNVFEAVSRNEVDLVFLAIEPVREKQIAFTAPYVLIEGNFVVRDSDCALAPADVDVPGRMIAVVAGSAYDLYLSRTIKHARLVRYVSHREAVSAFKSSEADAAAGIRAPMQDLVKSTPGLRLIEQPFMTIRQAAGLPAGRRAGHAYLCAFIEEMKRSGFVFEALANSGQTDFEIAPLTTK